MIKQEKNRAEYQSQIPETVYGNICDVYEDKYEHLSDNDELLDLYPPVIKRTHYYRKIWKARKKMLKWCFIISLGIAVFIAVVLGFPTGTVHLADVPQIICFTISRTPVLLALVFPILMVIIAIFRGSAQDVLVAASANFIASVFMLAFWGFENQTFFVISCVICVIMLVVAVAILAGVAAIYLVYIPVSSIYYCVRAHKEEKLYSATQ